MSWKVIVINFGIVLLILFGFEAFLRIDPFSKPSSIRRVLEKGMYQKHPFLGSTAGKKKKVRDQYFDGDKKIYDVTYSLTDQGWRITSKENLSSDQCILFLGGSFTFGETLNDNQTLPYLVSKNLNIKTHNFGMMGYGPHHSLVMLEKDIIGQTIDCQPTHVVYTFIMHHINRVADKVNWGHHGPKYVLQEDGRVKHVGQFNDFYDDKFNWLEQSRLYQAFTQTKINDGDVNLTLAVIDQMRNVTHKKYPSAEFHIIVWDANYDKFYPRAEKYLKKNHQAHFIADILPDFNKNPNQYYIYPPYNYHPAAQANRIISQYLANSL